MYHFIGYSDYEITLLFPYIFNSVCLTRNNVAIVSVTAPFICILNFYIGTTASISLIIYTDFFSQLQYVI